MFENLTLFRMSGDMATHATLRQRVIAENIANADTPGYQQRDLTSFADLQRNERAGAALRTTRPNHRSGTDHGIEGMPASRVVQDAMQGPNGNSVSLEGEIMKTAQVRQQHDTALAVYRSSLSILRTMIADR